MTATKRTGRTSRGSPHPEGEPGDATAIADRQAREFRRKADPTPYFQKYGANVWAAVKGYLKAVGDATAAPVIEKYTGVLAAADVFTPDVAFWLMESIRLNRGYGLQVHP
jgi:hypothetical protein